MINEKRVIHMTHMEMERRKHKENYHLQSHTEKKDYLSYQSVLSFVEGTVIYTGLFVGLCCIIFPVAGLNLTSLSISLALFSGIIGYLVFLMFYMRSTRKAAIRHYAEAMEYLKHEDEQWEKLAKMYEEEEKDRAPNLNRIMEGQDDAVY
ncbi:MAG: hypothetical protein K6F00_03115 [Lachnospiraceae bacterium]|nr:hypothetical protein [Lachnospiraceae bacterium]